VDIVTTLVEAVRKVVSSYATHGYSGGQPFRLYYVENQEDQVFSIVAPYDPLYKRADLVLMVRIVNNQVIIDMDKTSVPLYDALKRAGIPESQITVAWQHQ
jgi:XisI protein